MADIEKWLAENYESIVADEARSDTFESIADTAEAQDSPELAAWARKRAAESGKRVTPTGAKPGAKSVRAGK